MSPRPRRADRTRPGMPPPATPDTAPNGTADSGGQHPAGPTPQHTPPPGARGQPRTPRGNPNTPPNAAPGSAPDLTDLRGSPRGPYEIAVVGAGPARLAAATADHRGSPRGPYQIAVVGAEPAGLAAATADLRGSPGEPYEIAVVGAGPAGLAAAVTAARAGCRVALVDTAPRIGGQFWRHRDDDDGGGHRDWDAFARLRADLAGTSVHYLAGTAVWLVEPAGQGFRLHTTAGPVVAHLLVLATGAYDRVLPFPGWELPGVVTLGAAQALLSGSGVPVGRRVVVAGAGPFLLPVAAGLLAAGAKVVGVYEAGRPREYTRHPRVLAGVPGKLREALGYAAMLARHRVPYLTGRTVVAAYGNSTVEAVDVARLDASGNPVPDSARRLRCDAVAVGFGFTPQLDLALALGCATKLDTDGNLVLTVDLAGQTTVPGVYAAGEVTGVGGATLALVEGRLVGAVAAVASGRPAPMGESVTTRLLARREAMRRFAALVHRVHAPPAGWTSWLTASTTVCRCEEVPVSRVRAAVTDFGATDARAVSALCHAGEGWCQGRVCGYATAALTAELRGRPLAAADLAVFAHRPLAHPIPLTALATP